MNGKLIFEAAEISDSAVILQLLTDTNLPPDGVIERLDGFMTARNESGEIVGVAGIERYGKTGLLRSVAVAPNRQTAGIGSQIARAVLRQAKEKGIEEIVLLTTTAQNFSPVGSVFRKPTDDTTTKFCGIRRNGRCRAARRQS